MISKNKIKKECGTHEIPHIIICIGACSGLILCIHAYFSNFSIMGGKITAEIIVLIT